MRRSGVLAVGCLAVAIALPSAASALTKTVYAGAPKAQTKKLVVSLLGNGATAFKKTYSPGFVAFSTQTVTINQGDAVKWVGLATNFHTVDLPGKSGHDLPLFVAGKTVTGVNELVVVPSPSSP